MPKSFMTKKAQMERSAGVLGQLEKRTQVHVAVHSPSAFQDEFDAILNETTPMSISGASFRLYAWLSSVDEEMNRNASMYLKPAYTARIEGGYVCLVKDDSKIQKKPDVIKVLNSFIELRRRLKTLDQGISNFQTAGLSKEADFVAFEPQTKISRGYSVRSDSNLIKIFKFEIQKLFILELDAHKHPRLAVTQKRIDFPIPVPRIKNKSSPVKRQISRADRCSMQENDSKSGLIVLRIALECLDFSLVTNTVLTEVLRLTGLIPSRFSHHIARCEPLFILF